MNKTFLLMRLGAGLMLSATALLAADPLRSFTGYDSNTLPANDDGSTGQVSLGFSADFFGATYSSVYVNNNGNVTFDTPLSTYTPFSLLSTGVKIIAPYFGDVDTRGSGSNPVTYGTGTLDGHDAFAVNWINVGVYAELPVYNTFQLVIVDRSDTGAGNFDFEFNYDAINWEAGEASGSNNQGLGGTSARVGYSNGSSASFELPGSAVNGSFLDTNTTTGLIYNELGTAFDGQSEPGRYDFEVRNGNVIVVPPTGSAVPEPSTYGAIAAAGLLALVAFRSRSRRAAPAAA